LDYELGVIIDMQFPGYFLVVADFINYAKQNGIPVGPGRGSSAGSLVAYAMRITDLDPFAMFFLSFLNRAQVDPDIDTISAFVVAFDSYVKDKPAPTGGADRHFGTLKPRRSRCRPRHGLPSPKRIPSPN
jgi:hypothetical protein